MTVTDDNKADKAAVRIFPPAVPITIIVAGLGLQRLRPVPAHWLPSAPERYWLGGVIITLAVSLILWSILVMRRTGVSESPYTPTAAIVAKGPYRLTRNSMYLQLVLISIGAAIMAGNAWILALTPLGALVLYRLAILPEEAYLEAKFGDAYRSCKNEVRRWI